MSTTFRMTNQESGETFLLSSVSDDEERSPDPHYEAEGEGKYGDRNHLFTTVDRIKAGDRRGNLYSKMFLTSTCEARTDSGTDLCQWLVGDADPQGGTVCKEVVDFFAEVGYRHYEDLDKPTASGGNFLQKVNVAIGGAVRNIFTGAGGQSGGGKMHDIVVEALTALKKKDVGTMTVDKLYNAVAKKEVELEADALVNAILNSPVKEGGPQTIGEYVNGKNMELSKVTGAMRESIARYYENQVRTAITTVNKNTPVANVIAALKMDDVEQGLANVLKNSHTVPTEAQAVEAAAKKGVQEPTTGAYCANHKSVSTGQSNELFKNVIQRWKYLTDEVRLFYSTFVGVCDKGSGGKWETVNSSEYERRYSTGCKFNLDDIRINLLKSGSDNTKFAEAIPLLPAQFTRLSYTGASGVTQTVDLTPEDRDALRKVYNATSTGGSDVVLTSSKLIIPSVARVGADGKRHFHFEDKYTNTRFPYDTDKLVRRMLYELATTRRESRDTGSQSGGGSLFGDSGDSLVTDMIDSNIWSRVSPGVYQKVDRKTGKVIRYGQDDPATRKLLKKSHSCYSTGYTGDCHKYIFEALLAGDEMQLSKLLKDKMLEGDFFEGIRKDVNNMHPMVALQTLHRFGFREHDVYDHQHGGAIRKIEDCKHWLDSAFLKDKFGDNDVTAIKGNGKLLSYLGVVVRFVNANPGILNSGLDKSDESVGHVTANSATISLGIPMRKEPLNGSRNVFRDLGAQLRQVGPLKPLLRQTSNGFMGAFAGSPVRTPGVLAGGSQAGGAASGVILRSFNEGSNAPSGADYIAEVARSAIKNLKPTGRYLKEEDILEFDRRLDQLKKDEKKLLTLVHMIEEYNRLLVAHGDRKKESLSRDKMEELLGKFSKVSNSHYSGQQAVQQLLATIEDQSDSKYKSIKMDGGH